MHPTHAAAGDGLDDGGTDGAEVKAGTDPTKAPSTPPSTGAIKLWLEAEASATLTQSMVVGTDAHTSGGTYVWVPNGQGNVWDATGTGENGRPRVAVRTPGDGAASRL